MTGPDQTVRPLLGLLLGLLLLLLLSSALPGRAQVPAGPPVPVRLQLKWLHQFQGAGFYLALERGYYREAGLDVRIIEGGPTIDAAARVVDGEADFGVGSAGLIVDWARGRPVVALAVLMQHSPFVLLARQAGGPDHVHALPGHRLLLETHAEELLAYLAVERVPLERLTILPHPGSVAPLIRGEAEAITAYTTSEPYDMRVAGVPYQVFSPRSAGIDFYGDTLFTSEAMLRQSPRTVEAFRQASLRGWRDALADPAAAIDLILARYAPHLDRPRLAFEAEEISRLMIADMVEIGYMHPGRWRHIAEGFAAAGLIPRRFDPTSFLYAPALPAGPGTPQNWLIAAGAAVLMLAAATILCCLRRQRLRLNEERANRVRLEEHYRDMARLDPLTGVPHRRVMLETVLAGLEQARAQGRPVSLLLLDVDGLRTINERFGQAAGDSSLVVFRAACQDALRPGDRLGRLDGDHFAVLLPETDIANGLAMAEQVRLAVEHSGNGGTDRRRLTVSIGVAALAETDTLDHWLLRAERALNTAKIEGRNRVVAA
ncbi:ABC transporter substrate-binding protein [Niveispirillum fermenti]|uniref:ABC transporter substrate-binding protein n=1 Tax=Niveispirillum fermenti TaxID=1233113 RepID=UPI003A838C23